MKKPALILLGVMIIVVGTLAWWFSDAEVIKRQTEALAKSLTIASHDGKSARLSKTQGFSSLLAQSVSCSVVIQGYESEFGHDDLQAAHHMMVHNCGSATAKTSNVEITMLSDTEASVTADLLLTLKEKNGTPHGKACDAVLVWKKNEAGKWKLDSIVITVIGDE